MPRGDVKNNLVQVIKGAFRKGTVPRRARGSGRVILSTDEKRRDGKSSGFRVLVRTDGSLTAAGSIYKNLNKDWQQPHGYFDPYQKVVSRGRTDTIMTDDGERVVRRYGVDGSNSRLTRLGRHFF